MSVLSITNNYSFALIMSFLETTGLEAFIDCKRWLKDETHSTYEQSSINANKEKTE